MRTLLSAALGLSFATAASADLQIVEYPLDVTRCAGTHAQIGVLAMGDGNVQYAWYKQTSPTTWNKIQEAWLSPGMPSPPTVYVELGTNRSVLSLPVTAANAGLYRVDIIHQTGDGDEDTMVLLGAPFFITPLGADVGSQGGVAGGDGQTDVNDFVVYIDGFFNSRAWADAGRQGGQRGGDGVFDNNDFVVFIDLFFNGCNQTP